MELVKAIFNESVRHEVIELLKNECSNNLSFLEDSTPEKMERIRFAAIKMSEGQIDGLYKAVDLAQRDWRDLLVFSGCGEDITTHNIWVNEILKKG